MGECLYISLSASFILRFNIQCIFIFISIVIHVHICECWNKIIELKLNCKLVLHTYVDFIANLCVDVRLM